VQVIVIVSDGKNHDSDAKLFDKVIKYTRYQNKNVAILAYQVAGTITGMYEMLQCCIYFC